jgi:hypothetical protein
MQRRHRCKLVCSTRYSKFAGIKTKYRSGINEAVHDPRWFRRVDHMEYPTRRCGAIAGQSAPLVTLLHFGKPKACWRSMIAPAFSVTTARSPAVRPRTMAYATPSTPSSAAFLARPARTGSRSELQWPLVGIASERTGPHRPLGELTQVRTQRDLRRWAPTRCGRHCITAQCRPSPCGFRRARARGHRWLAVRARVRVRVRVRAARFRLRYRSSATGGQASSGATSWRHP